jgi:membrane protease subunit HflK
VIDDARTRALAEALQSSFKVVRVIMVLLAVAFLGSGITTVESGHQALKLRFGEFKESLPPGLHFAWPYPIDEILQIPITENREIISTIGWLTNEDDPPQAIQSFQPEVDGYTVTGDGNTIHVKATMTFSLEDTLAATKAYEFEFFNVTNVLRSSLDNAVFHASARRSAFDAKTDTTSFNEDIENRVRKVIESHNPKLKFKTLNIGTEVEVPLEVLPDFQAYGTVRQTSSVKVDAAKVKKISIVAEAEGKAKVIESGGRIAANKMRTSIQAEAKSFEDQRQYYESNPELFEQRLVAEAMQRILTNAVDVFYLSGRTPRIWLNRTPEKRKLKESETP